MGSYLHHLIARTLQPAPPIQPLVAHGAAGAEVADVESPTVLPAAPANLHEHSPLPEGPKVREGRVAIPIEHRLDEVVGLAPRTLATGVREGVPPAAGQSTAEQRGENETGVARPRKASEAHERLRAPTQPNAGGQPGIGRGESEGPPRTLIQTVRENLIEERPAAAASDADADAEPLHRESPQPPAMVLRAVEPRAIPKSPKLAAAEKPRREPVANPPVVLSPRVQPALPVLSARQGSRAEARAPDVHITIGSVEIRAQTAPARPGNAPKSKPQRLSVSLADYLQRRGGQRS